MPSGHRNKKSAPPTAPAPLGGETACIGSVCRNAVREATRCPPYSPIRAIVEHLDIDREILEHVNGPRAALAGMQLHALPHDSGSFAPGRADSVVLTDCLIIQLTIQVSIRVRPIKLPQDLILTEFHQPHLRQQKTRVQDRLPLSLPAPELHFYYPSERLGERLPRPHPGLPSASFNAPSSSMDGTNSRATAFSHQNAAPAESPQILLSTPRSCWACNFPASAGGFPCALSAA